MYGNAIILYRHEPLQNTYNNKTLYTISEVTINVSSNRRRISWGMRELDFWESSSGGGLFSMCSSITRFGSRDFASALNLSLP